MLFGGLELIFQESDSRKAHEIPVVDNALGVVRVYQLDSIGFNIYERMHEIYFDGIGGYRQGREYKYG